MKTLNFTDIHFGNHQDSLQHNKAALATVDEYIEHCKVEKIRYGVFQGDWHNHRITIDVQTLSYSKTALSHLNSYFESVDGMLYFCIGNHDLYFRRTRDIHSLPILEDSMKNITLIEDPQDVQIGNHVVLMLPWLVPSDDLPKILAETKATIIMGHQEYSSFKWNSNSNALTDGLSLKMVKRFDLVLSGHYHTRQCKGNIEYIGSATQLNFGDSKDPRGYTLVDLKTAKTAFIPNTVAPTYHIYKISEVLKHLDTIKGNYIKIVEDVNLEYEQRMKVNETIANLSPTMLRIEPKEIEEEDAEEVDVEDVQEVDTILIDLLRNHTPTEVDSSKAINILRRYLGMTT